MDAKVGNVAATTRVVFLVRRSPPRGLALSQKTPADLPSCLVMAELCSSDVVQTSWGGRTGIHGRPRWPPPKAAAEERKVSYERARQRRVRNWAPTALA